jgi:hypothetical protein
VSSVTAWTGWDVRGGKAAAPDPPAAFEQLAVADGGADERYELLAVAARGFRPPRFVRVVGQADDGEPATDGAEGLRLTWSLLYRRIAETAPPGVPPYAIYLLGVNPPEGATDQDLDVFNDFYTNVHLPEVAERRRAQRAIRYELLREVRPAYPGAPRYLAAYEVDEAAASARRHVGPPYVTGPDVWQRHTTPWRLWYRRLATTNAAT